MVSGSRETVFFLSAYWVFTGSSYCFLTLCRLHIGTLRHSLTHLAFVIQECVIASSFFAHMFGIHQLKPCCVPHLPALLVAKSLVIRHEVFIETQRPTGTCIDVQLHEQETLYTCS